MGLFHADYCIRTTKLRGFFPDNTRLQQCYARYRTPRGEFKTGSFYRRLGLWLTKKECLRRADGGVR